MSKTNLKNSLKFWLKIIFMPLGVIALLIAVFTAYAVYLDVTLPAICKDLPLHMAYRDSEFAERVRKMYSQPITEHDLRKSLREQGFHISRHPNPESRPKVWGYVDRSFIPCNESWVIEWTSQGDGIAHDIQGRYNSACL